MPTKADRKRSEAAVTSFHTFYASDANWGPERWHSSLFPALCQATNYAVLINNHVSRVDVNRILNAAHHGDSGLEQLKLPVLSRLETDSDVRTMTVLVPAKTTEAVGTEIASGRVQESKMLFLPPTPVASVQDQSKPLLSHWNLDAASALCAHMLDIEPDQRILDLCAAPGGKSVAIAQVLFPIGSSSPVTGCLHANEVDGTRNKRLANNLRSYLPSTLFATGAIKTFQLDGTEAKALSNLPYSQGGYDRVLLDAPCSSERHIIHAYAKAAAAGHIAEEMARWRPGSSKNIAKVQVALLMSALKAVKIGGRVVYSTCSISSEENDGVVEKVMIQLEKDRKKGTCAWGVTIELGSHKEGQSKEDEARLNELSEESKFGRIVVPDHPGAGGWGPLFFCVLTKVLL
jgi:16S rRNA C967 or C1407 C5-methylase (RsmB/RsmF family)